MFRNRISHQWNSSTITTMLKALNLTVAFSATSILCFTATALSRPLTESFKYPIVSNSDINKPICYMQTADSKTFNLSGLCEKTRRIRIPISNIDQEGDYMTGQVANKTGKPVYQSKVHYEVLDEEGNVVSRGTSPTTPQVINPGQTATFGIFAPDDREVKTTFAEASEKP